MEATRTVHVSREALEAALAAATVTASLARALATQSKRQGGR